MLTRCPNCGASMSLDALIGHDELRALLGDAVQAGLPFGKSVLRYLGLFRPAQRELRPERAARLLRQLLADVQRGAITRRGRDWPATPDMWQAALEGVLDAAAKGSLQPPLLDHGYLHEVLMRLSDKQEARHEAQREQARRNPSRPAAVQVQGQAVHVADALGKDPALLKLEQDARNATPMPAAVRERLQSLKKGKTP